MSETQPYRLFKEFLDTIIQIPENIKKKLADEFEKRRLKIQESENKLQEESENKPQEESENKPQEVTTIENKDNKSYFDDIFSKKQTDNMLNKFSKTPSTLSMSLKHKCQIRPW